MNLVYSTLLTFAAPLLLGYLLRQVFAASRWGIEPLIGFSRWIKHIFALVLAPLASILSLWVLNSGQARLALLPVIGIAYYAAGGLTALGAARLMKMEPAQRGAFFVDGMTSNGGALGGVISYLMFGEAGYALNSFFRLLENPFYYMIGYPVASTMGTGRKVTFGEALRQLSDPSIFMPIVGVLVGAVLGLAKVPRPALLGTVNTALIPVLMISLALAIGITLRVGAIREYLRPAAVMAVIKFLLMPAFVALVAHATGLTGIDGGTPYRVALMIAFMPVGFNGPIAATLFDLDQEMANALWLTTSLLFLPILPLLLPLFRG